VATGDAVLPIRGQGLVRHVVSSFLSGRQVHGEALKVLSACNMPRQHSAGMYNSQLRHYVDFSAEAEPVFQSKPHAVYTSVNNVLSLLPASAAPS
jgi:hypothetical protein